MASDHPPSLRHRLLQGAAVGLALLLLYVLSVGPACYAVVRFPRCSRLVGALYGPLEKMSSAAGLLTPLISYEVWWARLAGPRFYP